MEKQFLKEQMMRLEANFTTERFKITKQMFDLWYEMFKDLEEEGVRVSINEYIRTSEYPPTVASIMKIYDAKAQEREELKKYIKGRYIYMCRWYEEHPDDEIYSQIIRLINAVPKEKRHEVVENISLEAVRYYNDALEMGASNITIKQFLENYESWKKKDK